MENSNELELRTNRKHTRSVGRAQGVANYSMEDTNLLVQLVEAIRPTGKNGWNRLADTYNPTLKQKRAPDGLRRKFLSLAQPTRMSKQASIPEISERARKLYNELTSPANIALDMDNDKEFSTNISFPLPSANMQSTSYDQRILQTLQMQSRNQINDSIPRITVPAGVQHQITNEQQYRQPTHANGNNMSNHCDIPTISDAPNTSTQTSDINQTSRQGYDAIALLTNAVNNLIAQNHRQHEVLIAALESQHRSFQQQYQNQVEIQRQQTAELTSILTTLVQSIPRGLSNPSHQQNYSDASRILNSRSPSHDFPFMSTLRDEIRPDQSFVGTGSSSSSRVVFDGSGASLVSDGLADSDNGISRNDSHLSSDINLSRKRPLSGDLDK